MCIWTYRLCQLTETRGGVCSPTRPVARSSNCSPADHLRCRSWPTTADQPPAVSQHLKVLRDDGLVVSKPVGTRRIYRLNPQGVGALRTWLEGVWNQALTDIHKVTLQAADQAAADNFSTNELTDHLHPEQEQ